MYGATRKLARTIFKKTGSANYFWQLKEPLIVDKVEQLSVYPFQSFVDERVHIAATGLQKNSDVTLVISVRVNASQEPLISRNFFKTSKHGTLDLDRQPALAGVNLA